MLIRKNRAHEIPPGFLVEHKQLFTCSGQQKCFKKHFTLVIATLALNFSWVKKVSSLYLLPQLQKNPFLSAEPAAIRRFVCS